MLHIRTHIYTPLSSASPAHPSWQALLCSPWPELRERRRPCWRSSRRRKPATCTITSTQHNATRKCVTITFGRVHARTKNKARAHTHHGRTLVQRTTERRRGRVLDGGNGDLNAHFQIQYFTGNHQIAYVKESSLREAMATPPTTGIRAAYTGRVKNCPRNTALQSAVKRGSPA